MTILLRFLAFIIFASPLFAARDDVTVDVIAELTEAGKKIEHPTPERPAYYATVVLNYRSGGQLNFWNRPPPSPAQAVETMAEELSRQGYLAATHDHPPSLLLTFSWGFKQPIPGSFEAYDFYVGRRAPIPTMMMPHDMRNVDEMLDLTAGARVKNAWVGDFDNNLNDAVDAAGIPRYFIVVVAFDYSDWVHRKFTTLWTARVSVPYWGHYYDQTLPVMLKVGAPMFGRDMAVPQFIKTAVVPEGRVVLGVPVVKGFETPAAAPSQKQ